MYVLLYIWKGGGQMRTFIELEGTETEGDIEFAFICFSIWKSNIASDYWTFYSEYT